MSEAVSTSRSDVDLDRIKTQFFSTEKHGFAHATATRWGETVPLIEQPSRRAELAGVESCLLCVRDWNIDYPGPCFAASNRFQAEIIDTLSLSVTTLGTTTYGIKATGYLYDGKSGAHTGRIDLRYFGSAMPRTLTFDVAEHRLSCSTQIEIRFAVDGGGAPRIPKPPAINSVSLHLVGR